MPHTCVRRWFMRILYCEAIASFGEEFHRPFGALESEQLERFVYLLNTVSCVLSSVFGCIFCDIFADLICSMIEFAHGHFPLVSDAIVACGRRGRWDSVKVLRDP